MTVGQALFSFQGRMCRRDYWLKGVLVLLPFGILNNILMYGVATDGARAVSMIIALFSLWPALALIIKRLHDRNRSGWFALILLIPIIGPIWLLIEVYFLRGTIGANRFGDDPVDEDEVLEVECPLCKTRYRIGEDSIVTSPEDVFGFFGENIVGSDKSIEAFSNQPDIISKIESQDPVYRAKILRDSKETASMIRKTLSDGNKRYWKCHICDNTETPTCYNDISSIEKKTTIFGETKALILGIVALIIITLIVAILITEVILKEPKSDEFAFEQTYNKTIDPELKLEKENNTITETAKEEPLSTIIDEESNKTEIKQDAQTVVTPKVEEKTETATQPTTPAVEEEKTPAVTPAIQTPTKVEAKIAEAPKQTAVKEMYYVQVGAYKALPNKTFLDSIKNNGYNYETKKVDDINKLLIGPYSSREEASKALARIKDLISKNAFLVQY